MEDAVAEDSCIERVQGDVSVGVSDMEEKRTLIETFLPVEEISAEAKKEKLGTAKPRTFEMHYWWTRKPLITARAAVLGALLPSDFDIQEFKKLLGLGCQKRAHNYDIPLERLEQLEGIYKQVWGENPVILDPFAGGGSIPFEAMRVGVNAIANDYNPVANLILKATLEYPKMYGKDLLRDVEDGIDWVLNETKNEVAQYYPKHNGKDVVAYMWAWVVECPKCGFQNPLLGQWWLCRKDNKKRYLDYEIPQEEDITLSIMINKGNQAPQPNCTDGKGKCLKCNATISQENVQNYIKEHKEERLLVVVLNGEGGKEYDIASEIDFQAYDKARRTVLDNWNKWIIENNLPTDEIPEDKRGSLSVKIYLKDWHNVLNFRQKLLFVTLVKNIKKYRHILCERYDKHYVDAIITYLSLILGKHIDRNCRSTSLDRTYEVISHALAVRGVAMSWDHAEVNPFIKGSGSLIGVKKSILDALDYSITKLESRGAIEQIFNKSATTLDTKVNIIVSDPPYFDDVRYAEFSEFFFSWEKIALHEVCETDEAPKTEEMSVGGWGRTPEYFSKLFTLASKKMYNNLKEDGLIVLFFAHSSIDAWDFVVNSLQKAGFRITATWPVHTESSTNPLAQGHASIMSSIIIVARKRKEDKSGYIEEIQEELHDHIGKRLDEFWNYGLRGADLTVASMGATLDVITQYSDIKSYTGEMTIKDVLKLVQTNVAHYVLNRYMKNASSLDTPTAFYLYARLSSLDGMPFDTANLIAKSMDIDLKILDKEGLVELKTTGKAKGVKLKSYQDREIATSQTFPMTSLINAVHYMMAAYAKGGYAEVESVLSSIPYGRNELKDILEAFQSLPPGDPERQTAQQILERMGTHFPRRGQQALDQF